MKPLHEDDHYAVFEKPWGISTHSADEGDLGLCEWLKLHHGLSLFVVSRLDKETSGPIIFAKTRAASAEAEVIHVTKGATKTYQFISVLPKQSTAGAATAAQSNDARVFSRRRERSSRPVHETHTSKPIDETKQKEFSVNPRRSWRVEEPLDGKPACTEFQIIEELSERSFLIEATIHAGRKHQIRRHAAISGFPILGDSVYGGMPFVRVMLHCTSLNWPALPKKITSQLPGAFLFLKDRLLNCDLELLSSNIELLTLLALDRRGKFFTAGSDAFRIVHRQECIKDFAIECFGKEICVWVYDEHDLHDAEKSACIVAKILGFSGGVVKSLLKDPHNLGVLSNNSVLQFAESAEPTVNTISEHGLIFKVNLHTTEQNGFFIDQRDNRRRVFRMAKSLKVANLFAYTCSFSVVAAAAGARSVVSVDVSKSALSEGLENLRINNLEQQCNFKLAPDDVRVWLERQVRKSREADWEHFNLVICDPPTFGKTAGKSAFRIQKEWSELAKNVAQILHPTNGQALFCTNNRRLETEDLKETLQNFFHTVVRHRTPLDFPETVDQRHNRFFWCSGPIQRF